MKVKFKETIEKLGINEADLSPALKKKIRTFNDLNTGISEAEKELKSGNVSEQRAAELRSDIEEWTGLRDGIAGELPGKIESWHTNRPANIQRMADMRNKKGVKVEGTEPPAAPIEPPTEPVVETPPAPPTEPETPPTPETPPPAEPVVEVPAEPVVVAATPEPNIEKDTKKSKTPWGWVVFGVLVVAGAFVGANLAKNE